MMSQVQDVAAYSSRRSAAMTTKKVTPRSMLTSLSTLVSALNFNHFQLTARDFSSVADPAKGRAS